MTNSESCDHPTADGSPCEHPACRPDDKCWIHTEHNPDRPGGRPTKLSHDRQERIAQAIETGDPIEAACKKNGITYQTHNNWMQRGDNQSEGIYAEYFDRLTRALGLDQSKKTKVMWETAKKTGNVDAMLTVLKQRYPGTWGDSDLGESTTTINLERHVSRQTADD